MEIIGEPDEVLKLRICCTVRGTLRRRCSATATDSAGRQAPACAICGADLPVICGGCPNISPVHGINFGADN
jgi:hypothetical protein